MPAAIIPLLEEIPAEPRPVEPTEPAVVVRRRGFDLLLFFLATVPAAFIVRVIARYGVNVPFGDEWFMVPFFAKWNEHRLTFGELFRQHNEHRILISKLIFLGFAQFTHWNVKAETFFSVFLCGITSVCLLGLLRKTIPGTLRHRLCLWGTINLLIFCPAQAENWVWGFKLQMFIPAVCLTTALFILAPAEINLPRFSSAAFLALIATFSFANGLFLWPLIGLYLGVKTSSRRWVMAWAALFAVVVASYFFGYQPPPPVLRTAHSIDYLIYFLRFNGNALGQLPLPGGVLWTSLIGATALLLFGGAGIAALKRYGLRNSPAAPWIALGIYAISSAIVACVTRIHEGTFQAIDSRYSTISINLYIGLIGLLALLARPARPASAAPRAFRFFPLFEVTFLIAILLWDLASLPGAVARTGKLSRVRLRGLANLEFCKIIPPSGTLRRSLAINVDFPEFLRDVETIQQLQLLDPPLRTSDLLYDSMPATNPPTDEFGRCETVVRRGATLFELGGWAFLPEINQPAATVVLAYRSGNEWHAFALADVGEERSEPAQKRGDQYRWSGWRRLIDLATLPKGVSEISAWGVDASTAEVYKLPGVFALPQE